MQSSQRIGFIGGGNMGGSLIGGLLQKGFAKSHILLAEPQAENAQKLKDKWDIFVTADNAAVAAKAQILVLAIKPQIMRAVIEEIAPIIDSKQTLILSIAAGITTQQIQRWLGKPEIAIIRAMPNTPALIGYGITGLHANEHTTASQQSTAEALMQAVGETVWVAEEPWMDIVTALSGSGPAYFYYVMEGLIKGAQALGLPLDIARKLTLHTALGSAYLALQASADLSQLRQNVTSKGGTTELGIKALKDGKLEDLLANALRAATNRGKTLSEEYD